MKLQHRIKFKKPRPKKPRTLNADDGTITMDPATGAKDATKGVVTVSERELKFARALTDTERNVRDTSLTSLRSFLTANASALTADDWARLWKALFYCLWMADKRPVISSVISDIVALTDVAHLPFIRGLFVCLAREWFGIDRLRLNKYYELIDSALSRAVAGVVESADKSSKDTESQTSFQHNLEHFLAMLDQTVFAAADRGALGLGLHVLDRHLDCILKPLLHRSAKMPGNKVHAVFDAVMETPMLLLSSTKGYAIAVSRRLHEQVFERLPDFLAEEQLSLKLKDRRDMVKRVSKRVWGAAAAKDALPEVRKLLYDNHLTLKAFITQANADLAEKTGVVETEPKPQEEE